MPTIISLLRGVNVVGRNQIKMDQLRALYESLKFTGCQTYINSGNVVFCTRDRNPVSYTHLTLPTTPYV